MFGNGKFDTLEDLIKVVSGTIYLGSVAHAAANFCQYDEYAFPANYPATLNGKPPSNKVLQVQIAYYIQIQKKFILEVSPIAPLTLFRMDLLVHFSIFFLFVLTF